MREIKFRVWSNDGQMMHYFDLVNYMQSNEMGQEDLVPTLDIEKTPLMQFTGLKDKNGVEIYEGDIIRGDRYPFWDKREPNYVAVVEWIFAGFQYVYYCINPKKRGISDGINNILESGEDFEIIGNIYEDSELVDK